METLKANSFRKISTLVSQTLLLSVPLHPKFLANDFKVLPIPMTFHCEEKGGNHIEGNLSLSSARQRMMACVALTELFKMTTIQLKHRFQGCTCVQFSQSQYTVAKAA